MRLVVVRRFCIEPVNICVQAGSAENAGCDNTGQHRTVNIRKSVRLRSAELECFLCYF